MLIQDFIKFSKKASNKIYTTTVSPFTYVCSAIFLLSMSISSCSNFSASTSEPYVDTLITLMQRSQPVLEMAKMPARFYCENNHWPTIEDIYSNPANRQALALIADLKTEELKPSGFSMRFHLKKQMSTQTAPFIKMNVLNSPTPTECASGEFIKSKAQISIDTPDNKPTTLENGE